MSQPAGSSPRAWIVFLATAVAGLIIDLWSKAAAFRHIAETPVILRREDVVGSQAIGRLIPPHDPIVVVPSLLELTLVLNPGAVFGIGAGKRWFFVVFTLVAVALATWLFARKTLAKEVWAHTAFALVVAGGLGNLYDRVVFACVRDFLHPLPGVRLPFGLRWPNGSPELWPYVSNVADAFLLVGIGLLVIYSWRKPDPGLNSTQA